MHTDLALHARSVPFVRTLGAGWLGGSAAGIRMRLPWAPAVCAPAPGRAIDLRAVVALLDHAGGSAVYAAHPAAATATLELRIDVTGAPQPTADVTIAARVAALGAGSALVLGEAWCGEEPTPAGTFARLTARYIVGSGPGQAEASADYMAARDAAVARYASVCAPAANDFGELLGCRPAAAAWRLPFAPWLVGSVTLPALHGGVVAAGLMAAAQEVVPASSRLSLAGLTVQFLRAAEAVETRFEAHLVKAGARALFIGATARQGGRDVATLQCLYG
jgi:acyl-coenzyme A thioesterase PaaI-like protein